LSRRAREVAVTTGHNGMGLGFDRLRAVAKRGQVILVVGRQVALRAATPSPPPIWSTSSQWSAAAG